jgi:hypothetical protein
MFAPELDKVTEGHQLSIPHSLQLLPGWLQQKMIDEDESSVQCASWQLCINETLCTFEQKTYTKEDVVCCKLSFSVSFPWLYSSVVLIFRSLTRRQLVESFKGKGFTADYQMKL